MPSGHRRATTVGAALLVALLASWDTRAEDLLGSWEFEVNNGVTAHGMLSVTEKISEGRYKGVLVVYEGGHSANESAQISRDGNTITIMSIVTKTTSENWHPDNFHLTLTVLPNVTFMRGRVISNKRAKATFRKLASGLPADPKK